MSKQKYTISQCVCPDCNNIFPIPRRKNRRREKQHIKDLWCPYCKEVKKMVEYRNIEAIMTLAEKEKT